ncbi:metal-dependent hydrolase, partial [Acinetobacter baumannii]
MELNLKEDWSKKMKTALNRTPASFPVRRMDYN